MPQAKGRSAAAAGRPSVTYGLSLPGGARPAPAGERHHPETGQHEDHRAAGGGERVVPGQRQHAGPLLGVGALRGDLVLGRRLGWMAWTLGRRLVDVGRDASTALHLERSLPSRRRAARIVVVADGAATARAVAGLP